MAQKQGFSIENRVNTWVWLSEWINGTGALFARSTWVCNANLEFNDCGRLTVGSKLTTRMYFVIAWRTKVSFLGKKQNNEYFWLFANSMILAGIIEKRQLAPIGRGDFLS